MELTLQFIETDYLRLFSISFLGLANFELLKDEWLLFFIFITITGSLEWSRKHLLLALTHQHNSSVQVDKAKEQNRITRLREEIKKNAL